MAEMFVMLKDEKKKEFSSVPKQFNYTHKHTHTHTRSTITDNNTNMKYPPVVHHVYAPTMPDQQHQWNR